MNNFYRKIAVVSVCTALGFAFGASKEAKAATFSLSPTITSQILDINSSTTSYDGLGDEIFPEVTTIDVVRGTIGESALFTEFNIGSFSLAPNTVISSAVLQVEISNFFRTKPRTLGIFGYIGNGTAEASDFEAGVFLNSVDISSSSRGDILSFDVSPFVNQRVSNGDAFAGFGIRALNFGFVEFGGDSFRDYPVALVVETVPEPTTIFGSVLALGVGGWLKRKKSNQQNKTTPQH